MIISGQVPIYGEPDPGYSLFYDGDSTPYFYTEIGELALTIFSGVASESGADGFEFTIDHAVYDSQGAKWIRLTFTVGGESPIPSSAGGGTISFSRLAHITGYQALGGTPPGPPGEPI
jgi:hypothetical protein